MSNERSSDASMSFRAQHCCNCCFRDKAIKDYIEGFANRGNCTFCDAEDVFIIDVAEIAFFIDLGIEKKYRMQDQILAFELSDLGIEEKYCTSHETSSIGVWDILYDEEGALDADALCDKSSLCDAISDASKYKRSILTRKDPYGEPLGSAMYMSDWQEFCQRVKHEFRFTIFLRFLEHTRSRRPEEPMHPDIGTREYRVNCLWRDMDKALPRLSKSTTQVGTTILRAWKFKAGCAKLDEVELTSPPPEKTCNGRMSPTGISYFYGAEIGPQNEAESGETCVAEVRPEVGSEVVLAPFTVLRDLQVLNLCDLPPTANIFSEDYNFHFEEFVRPFLVEFGKEIARPVESDDEALEYIPTQVFSEFIRNNFSGHAIDGIRYKSALRKGGVCLVLFRGPEISGKVDPWLSFGSPKRVTVSAIRHDVQAVIEDCSTEETRESGQGCLGE